MAKKKLVSKKSTVVSKKKPKASVKPGPRGKGKKQLEKHRAKLAGLEKKLGEVDRQLAEIEEGLVEAGLSKSVLVEPDMEKHIKSISLHVVDDEDRPGDKSFYRNFVLRCESCQNQFERQIKIKTVRHMMYCPACGKDHTIGIRPSTRIHSVRFPKTLKYVKHK